jgi:mannose-6-phosphate isomerase-like protein (cupin superfamily)
MKRSAFLKVFMGLGAYLSFPWSARGSGKARVEKGVMVRAGKDRFGKSLAPFVGDEFFCKVSTQDTDGDLYIFESTRQKEGGPPLHYHYEQDEWWYILQGEFLIKVGEETYQAKAGDCVFGPRGVPHTFAKVGEGEARLIMLFQPAGKMEAFFRARSEGKFANMTEEELNAFRKAHGFEHLGPPLTILKK